MIDLRVKNIFDTKNRCLGACKSIAGCSFGCVTITHCILHIGLKRTGRNLELNDT